MSRRPDEAYMHEALRLARKGEGWTLPNPMVAVVLVKGGHVIARGHHRGFGMPHAEIEALRRAGARARGATLYVTLEPCAHFGKTPPCTDAIIEADVARVVIAARDPHRIARGGIEKLRKAGVRVSAHVCEREARKLNEAFFTLHERRRPFVALKFAASLDGKLATRSRDSKWITSGAARRFARALRGKYQAVLVGVETILADDPLLTARTKGMRDPIRIILDSRLRIPLTARVLADANVIIATTDSASKRKKKALERRGVRVLSYAGRRVPIRRLLDTLRSLNVASVLVEGGGQTIGGFIDAGVVDKIYALYAPILIGGAKAISIGGRGALSLADTRRFSNIEIERFADDILVIGSH